MTSLEDMRLELRERYRRMTNALTSGMGSAVCNEIKKKTRRKIGEPFLREWYTNKRCAVHIDNPSAFACLPEEMEIHMKDYMSKISLGYPETDPYTLRFEENIGVHIPSCKEFTKQSVSALEKIGCNITGIHQHEVDHIHGFCPEEKVEQLINLIRKARLKKRRK